MLVGCFREEKKVTVRRQRVTVMFFFLVASSASGSGRQAGMQHAVWSFFSWSEDFQGEVSEERTE